MGLLRQSEECKEALRCNYRHIGRRYEIHFELEEEVEEDSSSQMELGTVGT
jgi:hypothetical protein